MMLAYAARLAPQLQRTAGHELVQLVRERKAADAVKGVGVGDVYFMKLLRGAVPCRWHMSHLLFMLYLASLYTPEPLLATSNSGDPSI